MNDTHQFTIVWESWALLLAVVLLAVIGAVGLVILLVSRKH